MRYYILSFILHIFFIFCITKFSEPNFKDLETKRIVVYLSETNVEGKGNPNPAPLKNLEEQEEQKENKVEENKKIEKKKEIKKIEKKINKNNKQSKNKQNKVKNKKTSEKKENQDINFLDGLVRDGKGTYIGDQRSSQGIGYKVRREVDPIYPEMAIKMGFKNEVVIQTKFLVGLDGKIEEIIFLNDFTKYGFQKEVEKALKKWEFEPIIFHGKNIKMYFYKDFRFNIK